MTLSKLKAILKEWRMKRWSMGQIPPETYSEIITAMTEALNNAGWYVMPIVYGQYNGRKQFINADGWIVEESYTYPEYNWECRSLRKPIDGYDPYLDYAKSYKATLLA